MLLSDKTLYCEDCKGNFTFTTDQQKFFASKGCTSDPKQCPRCSIVRMEPLQQSYNPWLH